VTRIVGPVHKYSAHPSWNGTPLQYLYDFKLYIGGVLKGTVVSVDFLSYRPIFLLAFRARCWRGCAVRLSLGVHKTGSKVLTRECQRSVRSKAVPCHAYGNTSKYHI
jgi:hypothetical protein